jgi:hypothetical protein|tara:strand:+ start:704 stop:1069 length:366 start_codon:yes stop_codon:yes gene_type:complete
MAFAHFGINSPKATEWDRLRKEHPAVEKPSIVIDNTPMDQAMKAAHNFNGQEDMVNSPNHYTSGSIECIDGIEASMTPEAFRGYCKGAAIKYLWRYERKAKPLEDLKKAQWYLNKLISTLE